MSSPDPAAPPPPATPGNETLWHRVSDGRKVEDLWSQFAADARSSYGFYGKDVDWDEINKLPRWRRPFHIARQFFWALISKLSPARRIILIIALVLLFLSGVKLHTCNNVDVDMNFDFISALLFLLVLSLELADKVVMKRDLEIAREIQTWLVPSVPPSIPEAEVAFITRAQNSVAGDYYDAFYPTGDASCGGKLLLVMADVAGKSVPAALLMATLQASLRTIACESVSLISLATRLNKYACEHSLGGQRFTTAVIAEYDPATRKLTYVNAGHNAPILRHSNGDTQRLESGSLPFGITPDTTFVSAELDLTSGDTLVLFTDGVVEAFNAAGAEFTDVRWLNIVRDLPNLSAHDSLQFLMKQVDTFVGATRQSDDITCLILRCK